MSSLFHGKDYSFHLVMFDSLVYFCFSRCDSSQHDEEHETNLNKGMDQDEEIVNEKFVLKMIIISKIPINQFINIFIIVFTFINLCY